MGGEKQRSSLHAASRPVSMHARSASGCNDATDSQRDVGSERIVTPTAANCCMSSDAKPRQFDGALSRFRRPMVLADECEIARRRFRRAAGGFRAADALLCR